MAGLAALSELLDALFPRRCPVCGTAVDGPRPCERHDLVEELEAQSRVARCERCAGRLPRGLPDGHRCADCVRKPPAFQRTLTLGDYGRRSPLRDWILALKHGGRRDLAEGLGRSLAIEKGAGLHAGEDRPWLVPVPLHPWRRMERGYDQAALIARFAAEELDWPLVRALRRRRWTRPQGAQAAGSRGGTAGGAGSRQANVAGVFALGRRPARALAGRSIWLVDDVLTSGATASECARVLKRAGARQVGLLVVGRAGSRSGGRF